MDTTARTRDLFLRGIALVYMFAFGSIFTQIPGLYGRNGILPVSSLLQSIKEENPKHSAEALYMKTPTFLWFMPIEPDIGLEFLSILGIILSFSCMIWQRIRIMPLYAILWLLYLSIYKVGETFLWFQWDILLLEVGFITILVSPLSNKKSDAQTGSSLHRQLPFYLVKWLLFRLMFASGVVKLTSKCPTWWGLTALNYHYETQCIPTPLAWWAHQLPPYLQQASVIGTYVIEIGLPFLFFVPMRIPRLVAGYGQIILMILIYLSGNYNFFNILTAVLCLSLFDDQHLDQLQYSLTCGFCKVRGPGQRLRTNRLRQRLRFISFLAVLGLYSYFINQLFGYRDGKFRIKFTQADLQDFLKWVMPYLVTMAVFCFITTALTILYKSVASGNQTFSNRIKRFIKFMLILGPSVYLLTISMVRFADVESSFKSKLWPIAHKWHRSSTTFDLAHSYGLFRRMTGVEGRPEVVLEGSNFPDKQWKEYHFIYKPGKTTGPCAWAAPHQPRLDWQMWFAALGSYQHNPWLVSLMHRILIGQPEVLDLLDKEKNPFPDKPPKYLRAQLYHYRFTKLKKDGSVPKAWWKREFNSKYIPRFTKEETQILDFLKYHKLLPKPLPKKKPTVGRIEGLVKTVKSFTDRMSPPIFLWSLVLTALSITFLKSLLSSSNGEDRSQ